MKLATPKQQLDVAIKSAESLRRRINKAIDSFEADMRFCYQQSKPTIEHKESKQE